VKLGLICSHPLPGHLEVIQRQKLNQRFFPWCVNEAAANAYLVPVRAVIIITSFL
jgi:hypothetical protein